MRIRISRVKIGRVKNAVQSQRYIRRGIVRFRARRSY